MPYITPEERNCIDEKLGDFTIFDGGELQYVIARLIQDYYYWVEANEGQVRYKHMESMMGALNGANLEHYRCAVAPYEEKKIKDNGNVYGQRLEGSEY